MEMRIINLNQSSEEWLRWRENRITATNAASIMGLNPWQSRLELWQEKTLGWSKEPTLKEIERMADGTRLEPFARDAFCKEIGAEFLPACIENEDYSFLAASFDGITSDYEHAVEIKCGKKAFILAQCDDMQSFTYAQIQHQIMVADLEFIYYYCFNGSEGILNTVVKDNEFIDRMLAKEIEFWNLIQTFTSPELDYDAIRPVRT